MKAGNGAQASLFDASPEAAESALPISAPLPSTPSVGGKVAHFTVQGRPGHRDVEIVCGRAKVLGIHGFRGNRQQWGTAVRWLSEDVRKLGYVVPEFTEWSRLVAPTVKQVPGYAED